jgi:hypothetical protein
MHFLEFDAFKAGYIDTVAGWSTPRREVARAPRPRRRMPVAAPRRSGPRTVSPGHSFPMPRAHRDASCPVLPVRARYGPMVRPPSGRPLTPRGVAVGPSVTSRHTRHLLRGRSPCLDAQALPTSAPSPPPSAKSTAAAERVFPVALTVGRRTQDLP